MSLHTYTRIQKLPITPEQAWDFLSSPENLKMITPPEMEFLINKGFKRGEKMYPGMVISYTVRPMAGIPLNWVSEITQVEAPIYFVDEQRKGPYSFWQHKHFLRPIEGGVEMKDVVVYRLPLGFIGDFMQTVLVKNRLIGIFEYRFEKLEMIFGKWNHKGGEIENHQVKTPTLST